MGVKKEDRKTVADLLKREPGRRTNLKRKLKVRFK